MERYDPYSYLPDSLKIFDAASLAEVEEMAAGLSQEEILSYFNISRDQLAPNLEDLAYFEASFNRGRRIAKHKAVVQLFRQMSNEKNGAAASLSYLRQVSEVFPQGEGDVGVGKNFSFKVVLD